MAADEDDQPVVYVVPVEQTVERGLEKFLERSLSEAEQAGADHIILDIDTPGGAVDAAGNIAQIINQTDVEITAYVNPDAISAGAYIALNADRIIMHPQGSMGAAGVIDGAGNAAEDKAQSYWLNQMKNAAEKNGREPEYALAMASTNHDLPEYNSPEGTYLTLGAADAEEVNYSEGTASSIEELLALDGIELEGATIEYSEVSFAEQISRFVTHPIVIPILLSVGSLGLILELYTPGFGIPGMLGLTALGLFFFGHLFAGFAGWEAIILFAVGVILIVIEIFVPGFGVFGVLGIAAILGGMFLASFSTTIMLLSVAVALVVSIIAAVILFKYFGNRGPWKKIVLNEATTSEKGYISNETRQELTTLQGRALTELRPVGAAQFGEERLDVVSEGGYIGQGSLLKVVYTSGSRIVVREVKPETNHKEE
ncbi:nodulation protein NfeD [Alkalicoccobacillus porphyridii]|uniref:Nodulation protein NfeD n=1 Tax=Alkalicoccobacillus porphyridii TaxID=2597270 RepID=A0A553ZZH1_9BACI|nr:nodulation protein NfeD [Alkalicoccobacillus porphyridii]TSB46839.1 nodulation protein NfeD [Alkalicoccobacillus porphyridii]